MIVTVVSDGHGMIARTQLSDGHGMIARAQLVVMDMVWLLGHSCQ